MIKHLVVFILFFTGSLGVTTIVVKGQDSSVAKNRTEVQRLFVQFDTDKYNLKKSEIARLETMIRLADGEVIESVLIKGHTDSRASNSYNDTLSKNRMETVKLWLIENGIGKRSRNGVAFSFEGETEPLSTNNTASGRALNRRVEVLFYMRKGFSGGNKFAAAVDTPAVKNCGCFTIKLVDKTTRALIDGELNLFQSARLKDFIASIQDEGKGIWSSNIPPGNFKFKAKAPGYLTFSTTAIIKKEENLKAITIPLTPLIKGEIVELENMYFYPNKAVVKEGSIPVVKDLLASMQDNPTLSIKILGHVNWPNTYNEPVPKETVLLSTRRARAVYNYLIKYGVKPSRISYKGMGNTQMIYPQATSMTEMQRNMRVEIEITNI